MSIKSLLQIILFLLILVIVGGIYYLYFYSGPSNNSKIQNLEQLSDQIIVTEEIEILESITEPKIEKNEETSINQVTLDSLELSDETEQSLKSEIGELNNLINDFLYAEKLDSNKSNVNVDSIELDE